MLPLYNTLTHQDANGSPGGLGCLQVHNTRTTINMLTLYNTLTHQDYH